MSITSVTVTGVAAFASGDPIPNAVVSFVPDEFFAQSGTTVSVAASAIAGTSGAFSIAVNANDDVGTTPNNGGYFARVYDPVTGTHAADFRCHVSQANGTSQTFAALSGAAF